MKACDFAKTAWKLPFRTNVTSVIGLSMSFFLIFLGTNTFHYVYEQKQQPWEISVTPKSTNITDKTVNDVTYLNGVLLATPVINVDTTVKIGDYASSLTLKGVNSEYVGSLSEGDMFSDENLLPVIVMNKAAYNTFVNDKNKRIKSDEKYAELKTSIGDEKEYPAAIGGILQDNSTDSIAYISLKAARTYVLRQGKVPEYASIQLRLKNIGSSKSVVKQLESMGLESKDTLPQKQQLWDARQGEAIYITLSGICILIFVMLYTVSTMKYNLQKKRRQYNSLYVIGLSKEQIAISFAAISFKALVISIVCCYGGYYTSIIFMSSDFIASSVFSCPFTWMSLAAQLIITGASMACIYVSISRYLYKEGLQ